MKRNRRGMDMKKLYASISPENYSWLHSKSNEQTVSKSLLLDIIISRVRGLESNGDIDISGVMVEANNRYND
ncbi:MAG: hypothetical protein CL885_03020 [Dehalococcoidia bacterium]|nr:hypothetical protein [Dehalococcoidia bacterium]